MKRREFIVLPAKTLGGLLIYTLAGLPIQLHAGESGITVPLRFLTGMEAAVVAAACGRIMPSDENGPGAKETGVVIYIDRQLAGPYGLDRYRYTKGPFVESGPEHGYQGRENPREIYRGGVRSLGKGFADMGVEKQDDKLRTIERTLFFQMLRRHTIEGMFSDPLHGGNAGMIGWQLIGYPGPRMDYTYRQEIDKNYGRAWRAKPTSLEEMAGMPVKGWEEEKE